MTIFLSLSPEIAAQRGGYGDERYEKEGMQRKVREAFAEVEAMVLGTQKSKAGSWRRIDAGRTQDEVWQEVWHVASQAIKAAQNSAALLSRLAF